MRMYVCVLLCSLAQLYSTVDSVFTLIVSPWYPFGAVAGGSGCRSTVYTRTLRTPARHRRAARSRNVFMLGMWRLGMTF